MSCDMFSTGQAEKLLRGKFIYFFGDSNMRALYKDLLWLLEDGSLTPNAKLKRKNEESHANDHRVSNGRSHGGRNYNELREYQENPYMSFQFLTRLYQQAFIDTIKTLRRTPDIVVINSCVWDLTRWGANGVQDFKENIQKTFTFLKSQLPSTRIIWVTTLPPSFKSQGGFLTKEIEFMRNMLPWHIVCANKYSSDLARSLQIDVLDFHYNFRLLMNYHVKDGIHWNPKAMRHATNLLLTHISLVWNHKLPGRFQLDKDFLDRSHAELQESKSKGPQTNVQINSQPNCSPHVWQGVVSSFMSAQDQVKPVLKQQIHGTLMSNLQNQGRGSKTHSDEQVKQQKTKLEPMLHD